MRERSSAGGRSRGPFGWGWLRRRGWATARSGVRRVVARRRVGKGIIGTVKCLVDIGFFSTRVCVCAVDGDGSVHGLAYGGVVGEVTPLGFGC